MKTTFWKNKKILVTGADGFIGSYFIEELLKLGANVIGTSFMVKKDTILKGFENSKNAEIVGINLLDFSQIQKICTNKDIKIIIHCAALDGNIEFKIKNSARIIDENVRMTSNILNVAKEFLIPDVMLMSSAEIYSPNAKNPIIEEDDYRKSFYYQENGYVLSKIASEILAKLYAKQFGLNVFLPRPTNAYGPRDKFDKSSNRVIPSMIKKAISGESIEIWGDGKQKRGFIYVKDLVLAILRMIETKKYQVLNIATNEMISILDLAKLIAKIIGVKENIYLDLKKPKGVKERFLDVQKLNSIINFPSRLLKEGLGETVTWYKKILKK